jgi:HSP20 family protein
MPKSNAEKQQAGGQQGSPQNTQSTEMQTSGRAGRQGGGMERRGAYAPSLFSLSPREFLSASPFELMRRFSEEMDRAFEGFGMSRGMGGGGEMMRWAPAVEVFERDNKLIVHAELPGLNKDDVRVELTDEGLVLQGERRREHEERNEGFYRSERSYGHFYRLIPLPEGVDPEQVRAQFRDGMLEVVMPMPEAQSRRRSIPIETTGGQGTQTQAATGGGSSHR